MVFGLFKRQKNQNGKYKKPYYSITAVHAGRVLDIAQDGQHQGHAIIWEGYGGDNQMFTLAQEGADYYIKCKKNNQYLTVTGPQNGAKFVLAPKQQGNQNQRFRIDEKKGEKDHVIYTCHGKVLDVAEDKKNNGSIIVQWDYSGNKNQLWNFCDPKNITSSSSEFQ